MLIQLYPTGEVRWQGFDPNVIETIKQIPAKDAELARLLSEQGHSVARYPSDTGPERPTEGTETLTGTRPSPDAVQALTEAVARLAVAIESLAVRGGAQT